MRAILREMARTRMKQAGIKRINKVTAGGTSYFAQHWREYVGQQDEAAARKEKQRRAAWAQEANQDAKGGRNQ